VACFRTTSESAPLQLAAGKNAPRAVPISWSTPLNVPAPAADTQIGAAAAPVPQPAEHAIEAAVPSNDGGAGTLDTDNQPTPAALQTAVAPSPAAPPPDGAAAGATASVAEAPLSPSPANPPAPANGTAPANPEASGAPAQQTAAPAAGTAIGNGAPEQRAAAPVALAAVPAQQVPAAEIAKPLEAEPAQAVPAPQAHDTAAEAKQRSAGGAPVVAAAIAAAGAEPPAVQPAEITGSIPNAARPESAGAKVAAPHAKPRPKIVHKPVAKKPHKVAHAPAQPRHAAKKRIARRGGTSALAASAQPANTFENPVFQSAPEFQQPTKRRARAKNTATNNGFSNTFGGQFSTH
jgi:hypothetical protein